MGKQLLGSGEKGHSESGEKGHRISSVFHHIVPLRNENLCRATAWPTALCRRASLLRRLVFICRLIFIIIDLVYILTKYAKSITGPFHLTVFGLFFPTLFGPFCPTREWPFSPDPNTVCNNGRLKSHLRENVAAHLLVL